jgi:NAD(P)-dependent dehydrogenase (short-subunit alcohol dehydrogenase family)
MKNLFSVAGKVALVTGGSRGIGEMIAAGFLANGVKVYISSRKAEVCDATALRLVAEQGGECISIPADISSAEGAEYLAGEIAAREERLDILVNNAGAVWAAPLEEFPEAGWDKVMNTNVKGPFFLTKALLPQLKAAASADEPARVINIGSIDALMLPSLEVYSYTAAKAALHYLTQVLAARLAADDILVNTIAPGAFQSQMMAETLRVHGDAIRAKNPRKRIGTPEDIAGVAIFLSSRASAYTTGAMITCDGGRSTAVVAS